MPGYDVRTFLNRLKAVCQCCALGKDARRVEQGRPARCCALVPRRCCESYLSDGSVRYAHRLLRAVLQDAVLDELVADNVARNQRVTHRYRPKFTPWSAQEAQQFLKSVQADRWYALYVVALSLGLRRGELLGLRWVDVDLVDESIVVRHTLQRINGELRFGPVKTDDSVRVIPMTPGLGTALRAHLAAQHLDQAAAGDKWAGHDVVFATRIGTPIEPRNLNRHLDLWCERSGVRRIRFHDLRHSCATLLYHQGVALERIQDILGHSSPTVTKTIYIDATRKVAQDAVDTLGFLFEP